MADGTAHYAEKVGDTQEQHTESNVKTVLFQTIQFSISMQFKCQKSPISNNSVSSIAI